jgi:hypothetical protein
MARGDEAGAPVEHTKGRVDSCTPEVGANQAAKQASGLAAATAVDAAPAVRGARRSLAREKAGAGPPRARVRRRPPGGTWGVRGGRPSPPDQSGPARCQAWWACRAARPDEGVMRRGDGGEDGCRTGSATGAPGQPAAAFKAGGGLCSQVYHVVEYRQRRDYQSLGASS